MKRKITLAMSLLAVVIIGSMILAQWVPLTARGQAPASEAERTGGGGGTLSISGSTFVPENNNTVYMTDAAGGVAVTGGSVGDRRMHAPVHLPDGAQVSGITLHYYDNDGSSTLQARLYRNNDNYVGAALPLAITSSTDVGTYGSFYGTTGMLVTIDNKRYNYEIIAEWSPASANVVLMGVTVDFTNP